MTKIFIDANVIIAALNREYPNYRMAARVLSLADVPTYQVFTSATCLAISFYFASKKCGEARALEKIRSLCDKIGVSHSGPEEIAATLKDQRVRDFEDGIEHYSALHSGCQYIITEDVDDFFFASIPVLNCESFLRTVALPALSKYKQ
ncbi:MAG TPA: PIN domain-containing protein [Phnomibacter sp.]|nr:PIN domain-containing protein [Phnomibacter sp.]